MKIRLNRFKPAFLTDPSILWGLHSFEGDFVNAGPGHYRTGTYTGDGAGAPTGLFAYNSGLVRVVNSVLYLNSTSIDTPSGAVTFASLAGLLIWSAGTGTIRAYDAANAAWGAQDLGVAKPTNGFTLTAGAGSSGSMGAGDYWYRISYVDGWGQEGQPSEAKQVTSVPALGSVVIASIPPYTANKAAYIRVYRTYVDGSEDEFDSDYHLVAQISAASTTYTDTLADVSLTDDLLWGLEWGSLFRSIPAGTNLCVWGSRLAWSSGNIVYVSGYSETGAPLPGETYFWVKVGDKSDIRALKVLDNKLLIFKSTPAIYALTESTATPFRLDDYSTSYGVINSKHVVNWLGGLAFYLNKRVYSIPGFNDLTELIQPMFSELATLDDVHLGVDVLGRLMVMGRGNGGGYPAFGSNTKCYSAYIYSPGTYGWTKTMNFDWLFSYADHLTGITYGLDKNGWLEKLDWATIAEKTSTAVISTSFTVDSTTKITFTDSTVTTAMKVGDYVVYWDPVAYRAAVTTIATIPAGSKSITTADAVFAASGSDPGLVSIGKVFVAKSASVYGDNGEELQADKMSALLYSSVAANRLCLKYNTQGYPKALSSILRDNDYLWQDGDTRKHWRLTPYLEGVVSGGLQIDVETLRLKPFGRAGDKK